MIPYKTDLDYSLYEKVISLSDKYFGDMLLRSDEFIGNNVDFYLCIKDVDSYSFAVDVPGDDSSTNHLKNAYALGEFNADSQMLTVRYDSMNDDHVILHEMIHMFEYGLNASGINLLREKVLFSLYIKLSKEIPDLPTMCERLLIPDVQEAINDIGGEHGLLFFLKSLDIDLKNGWPLCTTLGDCYSQYFIKDANL